MRVTIVLEVPDSHLDRVVHAVAQTEGRLRRDDAARLAHMSASTFTRDFKRTFGLTFRQFQLETRLRVAAHLLRETSLRISQIAERLGYSDLNKFEQAFKRRFSTAPTCYRKTQRNAAEL